MKQRESKGLRVTLCRYRFRETIRAARFDAVTDGRAREEQVAQRAHQDKPKRGSNAALPGYTIGHLVIARLGSQHGNDEEEQDHNCARVDQDLHDGNKHRP